MKLFRILIVSLYFTMGLDMDVFVVGQDTKMISSGGPEMFPILRSSKYLDILHVHFFFEPNCKRFELFVPQAC